MLVTLIIDGFNGHVILICRTTGIPIVTTYRVIQIRALAHPFLDNATRNKTPSLMRAPIPTRFTVNTNLRN